MKICPQCGRQYPPDTRFCPDDGATLRAQRAGDDLVGETIADRYHVIRKLGAGGMGTVYLAEHVRMKRKSAVKVMNPHLAHDPDAITRFNREAENASQILHPHVAAIYDFGETREGLIYLAMEFVDGEPLSRLIDRHGALPPARAAAIVQQTAAALSAAHELGIVHRDLKPDNIMIAKYRDGSDCVKVVDFGIAKVTHRGGQTVTRTGLAVGTPEYMSPEQLAGDKLDARSDIYSLGLVAFHILTGDLPFPLVTSAESLVARLTERPKALRDVRRGVSWPPALQAVLDRALDPSPATRFQSAAELGRALVDAVRADPGLGAGAAADDAAEGGAPTVAMPTPQSPIVPLAVPAAAAKRPSGDTQPSRPGQVNDASPHSPPYEPPAPARRPTPTAPRVEVRAETRAETQADESPPLAHADAPIESPAPTAPLPAPEPAISITRESEALFRRRPRRLYGFVGLGTVAMAALLFAVTRGQRADAPADGGVVAIAPPDSTTSSAPTPVGSAATTTASSPLTVAARGADTAAGKSGRGAGLPAATVPAAKTGQSAAAPPPAPPVAPDSVARRRPGAESTAATHGPTAPTAAASSGSTPANTTAFARPATTTPPPATAAGMRSVGAGGVLSCGVLTTGSAACWGEGRTTPVELAGGPMARISIGDAHGCGLRGAAAYCWGANGSGQLGDGSRAPHADPAPVAGGIRFREVSAGRLHSCGIAEDGRAYCWGSNRSGQLGIGSTRDQSAPTPVKSALTFIAISAGGAHTCALASDQTAYCWGDGFSGALGHRLKQNESEPVQVAGRQRYAKLVAGAEHTCAVDASGKVFCWGGNRFGQLGDGSATDRLQPTPVSAPTAFTAFTDLAAGTGHTCALAADGSAYCWGSNASGQLGAGASRRTPARAVDQPLDAISAGANHSCGLARGQQTALCWGDNRRGQLGDGGTQSRADARAVVKS